MAFLCFETIANRQELIFARRLEKIAKSVIVGQFIEIASNILSKSSLDNHQTRFDFVGIFFLVFRVISNASLALNLGDSIKRFLKVIDFILFTGF